MGMRRRAARIGTRRRRGNMPGARWIPCGVIGNRRVSTSVILQLVRTREGDKFDPATVVGDYQRIYDRMKKFADVEARVQPTATGVIVIFIVTEQKQIKEIRYHGNVNVTTHELQEVVDLKPDEAIDQFRVNLAQQSIEKLYRDKNYPFAHANWSPSDLQKSGVLEFNIVEGPQVRVRKVDFIGNNSFSAWKLKDQIKTAYYIFIFRPGLYDPDQLDEDTVEPDAVLPGQRFFRRARGTEAVALAGHEGHAGHFRDRRRRAVRDRSGAVRGESGRFGRNAAEEPEIGGGRCV